MRSTIAVPLLTLICLAAPARAQLQPLNTVPSAGDVLGQPPAHFIWVRQNLELVRDPVNGDLVFLDGNGRVVARATLPSDFEVSRIEPRQNDILFVDQAAARQFTIRRDVVPSELHTIEIETTDAAGGRSVRSELRRLGRKHLVISAPGSSVIHIRALDGGQLADAYLIGTDAQGNRYAVAEELLSSSPAINVRANVEKFDAAGRITGIASVPLSAMDVVPRDFATVTDNGEIMVLVPTQTGVEIRTLPLQPTKPTNLQNTSRVTRLSVGRSLGIGRTINVESKVIPVDGAGTFDVAPASRSAEPTPPISRAGILATARSYLTVNWQFNRDNWAHSDVENLCNKGQRKFWLRPRHFAESMVGTVVGPMPYAWGGDDTPEIYRDRLSRLALAGDICTCRDSAFNDCVFFPLAAGVDCSGFVSRAWGIKKHGTAGLFNIATRIKMGDVKAGDALDWSGHHVRLFVRMMPGAADIYETIESATRRDCEGVCERAYRPSELNGYTPIRYKGATDK
jgi:hypothetical protein